MSKKETTTNLRKKEGKDREGEIEEREKERDVQEKKI